MSDEVESTAVTLDLSDSVPVDSFMLDIYFPGTNKPTGWKIEIAGPAHPKSIAVGDDQAREAMADERAVKFAQANGRKFKIDDESVADRRRKNVGRIVARIIGWSPNPVFKQVASTPLMFSERTAIDLFLRHDMGSYFSQIVDYLNSEKAFTKASATN